jgi:RimJ/RimL family protein N-acetyltransferase
VSLRLIEAGDEAALVSILDADPSIQERVSVAAVIRQAGFQNALAMLEEPRFDKLVPYAIVQNGKVVGQLSFWQDLGYFGERPDTEAYGFGFSLAPEARGQGLATAAVERLIEIAKTELGAKRIIAFCEDDNEDSKKVLKRLGLKQTERIVQEPLTGWQERLYVRELYSAEALTGE